MMSAMSRSSSTTRMSMVSRSVFFAGPWQQDHESGAARLPVLDVDGPTVQLDQRLHDCQTQPTTGFAVLNGFATTIELVEDNVAFGLGHTGSVVRHSKLH